MKTKMMIFFLIVSGFGGFAQKETDQKMVMFKDDKLTKAYEEYIQLKDALVASRAGEAQKAAGELEKTLTELSDGKKASAEASKIASTSKIMDQRKAFSGLSNEMGALVTGGKLSMGSIYIEYCPMANKNEGAYWLSNEKEIKNPYFGNAMLRCGAIAKTIKE